jgi:Amt family ammonium transporter
MCLHKLKVMLLCFCMSCHPCRNALAFGENHSGYATPFIGVGDFALSHTTDRTVGDSSWSLFLFHWAFSAAAATIMAGAIAERMTMQVYLGYTCLMTTLVSEGACQRV